MTTEEKTLNHLGTLIKNIKPLHDFEAEVGFNLHSLTFFKRLVPKEIMDKNVRVRPDAFYKGLIFLDYFCNIIADNYDVCDNLIVISKSLRKLEKAYSTLSSMAVTTSAITTIESIRFLLFLLNKISIRLMAAIPTHIYK